MHEDYSAWLMARQHIADLHAEARADRLAREARTTGGPGWRARIGALLGRRRTSLSSPALGGAGTGAVLERARPAGCP